MKREYEVAAEDTKYTPPGASKPYETGQKFETDAPLEHEQALLEGGILRITSSDKLVCEACAASKKKARKFDTYDELVKHYETDHAGLAPPSEKEV